MKQEINPQETNRAQAFELWMKSPMPMVTLTKVPYPYPSSFIMFRWMVDTPRSFWMNCKQ